LNVKRAVRFDVAELSARIIAGWLAVIVHFNVAIANPDVLRDRLLLLFCCAHFIDAAGIVIPFLVSQAFNANHITISLADQSNNSSIG